MITVTRIDGSQLLLNDDRILWIEVQHDTLLMLSTGLVLRVQETPDELLRRIRVWRRGLAPPPALPGFEASDLLCGDD